MIQVSPPITCFLCGTGHGTFKEWYGPDICENCWTEIVLDGQKITAVEAGNAGSPTLVFLFDGTCLNFRSLRKLREAIFEERYNNKQVAK